MTAPRVFDGLLATPWPVAGDGKTTALETDRRAIRMRRSCFGPPGYPNRS